MKQSLPIDEVLPQIKASLCASPNLVVEAPPGAGKTTRVPVAILRPGSGEVLVLEPRRLATRMAARRVASEIGEPVGKTVGYHVRFDSVAGAQTRLRFLTEGVLTRRMISDPELRRVDTVVLDEFHERHLEGDLALALLRRLQLNSRPELRIVVMSATLKTGPVARFLGDCPIVRSEGRLYPLAITYTPHSAAALEVLVATALDALVREGLDGDVLVFLPGAAEIRRAMRGCAAIALRAGIELLPLYGDLSPEERDRAVEPGDRRKVILSTNVAESSITVAGVSAVIDSGLARVARHSPGSGLPTLSIGRVGRASASQRAGRAGRLRPGRVIRLYPEADYVRRPLHDAPEIARQDLSQLCLDTRVLGITGPGSMPWLDAPPAESLTAAEALLHQLGALDAGGRLTPTGRSMARLPLDPRLARLVIEAGERGAGSDGCTLAALLSAGERLPEHSSGHVGPSDLLLLLDTSLPSRVRRLAQQVRRIANPRPSRTTDDGELLISVLTAFPDRVARRRRDSDLLLASGGGAKLASSSVVRREPLMVAVDVEERRDRGLPLVRLASGVKPEWLFDLFPERISERGSVEWNREAERVEAVSALLFDQIVIEESRGGVPDADEASALLADKAMEAGIGRFTDRKELDAWLNRVAFAAAHSELPALDEDAIREALCSLCRGMRSLRDLERASRGGALPRAIRARFTHRQRQLLEEVAPERIRLLGGRRSRVHYESGKPPWT